MPVAGRGPIIARVGIFLYIRSGIEGFIELFERSADVGIRRREKEKEKEGRDEREILLFDRDDR